MNSLSKKIIAAALAVLLTAVCVCLLGSCGNKTDGSETTEPQAETSGEIITAGFSAELTNNAVLVYKDSVLLQTLPFSDIKLDSSVDLDFAKDHISFTDLNFDGKDDLCVAISDKKGVISYICWLYTDADKPFVVNAELSAIKNISVNAEDKQIVSESEKDGKKIYTCYEWVDGALKEIKEYDGSEDVPSNVSKAAADNTIGTKKTTPKTTEASSAKPVKPAEKTTKPAEKTTKPAKTTEKDKTKPTQAPTKPAVTQAPQPVESGVELATNNIDDGWY